MPIAVIIVHAVAAALFGHQRELDPVFHFFGGGALAYFLFRASETLAPLIGQLTLFATLVLAFTGASTLALFWEFGEFLSHSYLGTHVQGGLTETIVDLLLGVGGATMFVVSRLSTSSGSISRRPTSTAPSRIGPEPVSNPEDAG